jgi:probable phosphoglycerate mutase
MSASQAGRESARAAFPGRHPGYGSNAVVWLVRHGEVDERWSGRAYGGLDVPLSEHGRRDSARTAAAYARLEPARVISSPLSRARDLGQELARLAGAPLTIEAGLREIDRGHWQGLERAELLARFELEVAGFYADPWTYDGHGGETDADVLARAWPALERGLTPAVGAGRIVVMTAHYNVIRVLCARALGLEPSRSFRLRIDPLGAVRLDDAPGGFVLRRANVRDPTSVSGPA